MRHDPQMLFLCCEMEGPPRTHLENVEPVIDWLLAALALIVLRSYLF